MERFLHWLWWACATLAAASFITDSIWLDGKVDAWVALVWLGIAVTYRLLWQQERA